MDRDWAVHALPDDPFRAVRSSRHFRRGSALQRLLDQVGTTSRPTRAHWKAAAA
ncbi:hypothetical protein ACFYRC_34220 [Streptomyces sp. NPDC005279]|uniref:hypothetical protein n=1 Tax=Streptomyces sp. NPDC005279 TaxID=3364712 RepID=UPI00368038DC